ncbi:MAG TPA: thioredoxin domain-containing protein [Nitrososphaeraceae archaeon]
MDNFSNNVRRSTNRLINESSPYLLQHAYNPVDWYPWGKDALQKATIEDKPIFLSIGYSACHWCHVMAHESFESDDIASFMNDNFVNIKVDREERPDIDDIYQKVCQLANGTGGWPLSVFLTPDQRPFYIGTYFPGQSRNGMPGFATILKQLKDAYVNKRQEIISATSELMQALVHIAADVPVLGNKDNLERSILDEAAIGLLRMADNVYGGFGQAPKFPNTSNLLFLLRYHEISGMNRFKDFVIFSAEKMAAGGIHDHLGGGFARYSTDQRWLIPHFEKMLYDNSLLVQLYAELYQLTQEEHYLHLVRKTLDYIIREMMSPAGGFYSAQDADSDGEEGKYYVWTRQEVFDLLGDHTVSEIFCDYYGVTTYGNFDGKNILYIRETVKTLAKKYGRSVEDVGNIIEESSLKLFNFRSKRVAPGLDDKILTSWNGLMISAFAKGYRVTGDPKYLAHATNTIDFIEMNLQSNEDGRLYRLHKNGISKLNAYLDDYAFYTNALLDVFEIDSQPRFLDRAILYANFMIKHFWDDKESNLFFTSDDHEKLIVRTKSFYDLAIPSGSSIAASNLLRLFYLTNNYEYLDKAESIMKSAARMAAENPFGFGHMLIAIYLSIKKCTEILVVQQNDNHKNLPQLTSWLNKHFIPNQISAIINDKRQLQLLQKYEFFKGRDLTGISNAREYALVCKDSACSLPILSVQDLETNLYSK